VPLRRRLRMYLSCELFRYRCQALRIIQTVSGLFPLSDATQFAMRTEDRTFIVGRFAGI
jgi:hypothetical protein